MILCAGLGTRLRPLTQELPKPAVPLVDRPLVAGSLALLAAAGTRRVVVNTHWLPEAMTAVARAEGARLGVQVEPSHEPVLLGTGGGLRQARDAGLVERDRPLLVLNGDVLFDADLPAILHAHEASRAAATLALLPMPAGATYQPVEADPDGRIRRIRTFGAPSDPGRRRCLFSGVHVIDPSVLDCVPPGPQDIVETAWKALLETGGRVQGVFADGTWLDLGDAPGYLAANLAMLDGTLPLPRLERAGFRPGPAIDPAALLADGARVRRSVVAANARVGAGAEVVDSVLWPGAVVTPGEHVLRTVVTPRIRVTLRNP